MKITAIRLDRMRLPLVPPFRAAWDPVPREAFDATLVRVEADEGMTGYGSGETMAGFAAFEDLFLGAARTWSSPTTRPAGRWPAATFFPAEPVRIDADGCLSVPERPGLGAEIDEAAVRRWATS